MCVQLDNVVQYDDLARTVSILPCCQVNQALHLPIFDSGIPPLINRRSFGREIFVNSRYRTILIGHHQPPTAPPSFRIYPGPDGAEENPTSVAPHRESARYVLLGHESDSNEPREKHTGPFRQDSDKDGRQNVISTNGGTGGRLSRSNFTSHGLYWISPSAGELSLGSPDDFTAATSDAPTKKH
ncbi:hypothetical protein GWI33_014750 [Rhynchophorus ferrugineus]|uniref:Uncharacterized protein n=1 Tax=Rhynchophorus ferrugineus TaxID=354439 RepID=A0A834I4H2_RHYFE|nr:hypothetical protein GWI33_014750 [Rhynchophorus ferrugineus]